MNTPINYKAQVRNYIRKNILFGVDGELKDDTSFLDSGTVDSTGVLEIIVFLESTFNIKIEPEETVPENLDSIDRISDFLTRKLAVAVS